MARPRKKMGRPLEDVPLRKLVSSIRQDIRKKLAETDAVDSLPKSRKSKKK